MIYADMHCDTLTKAQNSGKNLNARGLACALNKLKKSGCAAQCFAVFTEGENAEEVFLKSVNSYAHMLELHKDKVLSVKSGRDFLNCVNGTKTGCILTVENLGFTGGDINKLLYLKDAGVKMASLVWNTENALARPNLKLENGVPQPEKRDPLGLTALGKQAVEILDGLKIIVDISHLSDGGAEQILAMRKIPTVASHSNAAAVCNVSRNLTDGLIKKIAESGGVVGVNFYKKFLGEGKTFDCVFRHLKHIINVGGEDAAAFGSDFDGMSAPQKLKDCTRMPALLNYLNLHGICSRVLEKAAYKNFLRVFCEVCG